MATFLQDVRFAFRLLIRNPAVAIVAVLSLALGIGANTTVFTLVNAILLNPLNVRDVSRLVLIQTSEVRDGTPVFMNGTSRLNFEDLRDQNTVFSGITLTGFTPLSLSGGGEPEQVFGVAIRQGAQQHRVDDAEDRGAGADPHRQRDDRDQGEPGPPRQRAKGIAEVLSEHRHPPPVAASNAPATRRVARRRRAGAARGSE